MKPYYKGKPGPKPSGGPKRKILFPFALNEDEYEYLMRRARQKRSKIGPMLRAKAFPPGWPAELRCLREMQGANIKP